MTTVVWNYGKLVTDSRITYAPNNVHNKPAGHQEDNAVKIYEPKNMMIEGRKVLAVAVCGDYGLLKFIQLMEKEGYRDLASDDMFPPILPQLKIKSSLVVITPKRNYIATFKDQTVQWDSYMPYVPIVACGEPRVALQVACEVSPEMAVTEMMHHDPATGGDLLIWRYGKSGLKKIKPSARFFELRYWLSQKLNKAFYVVHVLRMITILRLTKTYA